MSEVRSAAGPPALKCTLSGDRTVLDVDRIVRDQAAVFGIKERNQPHQDRQQASVNVGAETTRPTGWTKPSHS
jgi:hypothetical protein